MSGTSGVSVGAQDRLARTIVRALAYLRAAQLAMWLWVPVVTGLGHVPPVVVAGYLVVVVWSVVLVAIINDMPVAHSSPMICGEDFGGVFRLECGCGSERYNYLHIS